MAVVAAPFSLAQAAQSMPKASPDGRAAMDPTSVLVHFKDTGWTYKQTISGSDAGFEQPGYDDSGWYTGQAGFGTTNGVCPWNNPNKIKTSWDLGTDMLLRRHLSVPAGMGLHIEGAVDNDAHIYINGQDVENATGGYCRGGVINVDVPASLVTPDTVLAIRGIDYGSANYLDVEVETNGCNVEKAGSDAGRGVSAQAQTDLGLWTHAADDFSCDGTGPVSLRTFSFDGRYTAGPGPVDRFRIIIRKSDPTGTLIEPMDDPAGIVCSYLKPYKVGGLGPVYHFTVQVSKHRACTLSPDTTYWMVAQAQMASTVGAWQWELQSGPAYLNDADWKTNDSAYGPDTCDTYSQVGGANPGGDRDLEDCLHLGETGAPDLVFRVS